LPRCGKRGLFASEKAPLHKNQAPAFDMAEALPIMTLPSQFRI